MPATRTLTISPRAQGPRRLAAALVAGLLMAGCSTVAVGIAVPSTATTSNTAAPIAPSDRPTTSDAAPTTTPATTPPPTTAPAGPTRTTTIPPSTPRTTTPSPTAPPDTDLEKYPEPAGPPRIPAAPKHLPDPYAQPADTVGTADAGPLLAALTDAMHAGDRKSFLSHFSGTAHRRASFWWDNLDAIGMDGGAVSTYGDSWNQVNINSAGRGWLYNVQAGGHFPGDDVDASGEQVVPTSSYYWKVQRPRGSDELTIVDWLSLDQVPWDCLCRLHVAVAGEDVVVSYPDEQALADSLTTTLATATAWNRSFFASAAPDLDPLGGVVAFATDNNDRLIQWFQSLVFTTPNFPGGVPAAAVHNMRGYSGDNPKLVSGNDFQGARMVVGANSAGWVTPILVHELVHYLFTRYDTAPYWLADNTYVVEGLAEMVQQVHEATPAEDAAKGIWTVGTRQQAWSIYPDLVASEFKDKVPSPRQLRLTDLNLTNFWYDVAASAYSYIAVTYGMTAAIQAGICSYGGHPLFSCVTDPQKIPPDKIDPQDNRTPGDGTFLKKATLQKDWARWFHKTYG